jgi:diguanylate cyclase (GGDEF)-like protein/hemerythrin-like metal-binding protein/PAS domain S-box-containing protein
MLGLSSVDPAWQSLRKDGSPFPGSEHPAMQALRSGAAVHDVVLGVFNPALATHTWINVNASPIRDDANGNIVAVYSVFQDITRQMLTEKRLHDKNAEFRIAIQTSSDGFWIADPQGKLLEVNEAYASKSGYTQEELLGLAIHDLDVLDQGMEVAERMQRIMRNGSERFHSKHKARDGRVWPVEIVAAYSPVAGGRFFCFLKDLTEQQHSAELIWHQANFDRLTDLPNRALFFDRLSQECSAARRSGRVVALLFADLDAFKAVNDDFGHDAGDVVLQTVAARWLACVRGSDTIARLGGDEFAIIVGDLEDPQEAAVIAGKLVAALAQNIALPNGRSCKLGVSVGIAIYPSSAGEMDSLLQAADRAMYECKAKGKNAFGFSSATSSDAYARANWIAFSESLLIGVAEIDDQHRQLVRMVNDINYEISINADDKLLIERVDELVHFTAHHFATEHRYMVAHQYPGTTAHDLEHTQLTHELRGIVQKRGHEGDLLVLQKIKDWLVRHIQTADRALGHFLNQGGVH